MEIRIEPQAPDGVNVSITNLILDTDEEAFEIIKLCRAIKNGQKIDMEECKKIFEST